MSVNIKVSGDGIDPILDKLTSPSVKNVTVGIHSFEDAEVLLYASWNEFGTQRIPPRPFLRQTFDKYKDEIAEFGVDMSKQVSFGKITLEQGLQFWGEFLVELIQSEINEGTNFKQNAQSTIKKKGEGLHPLQETGRLQQSIKAVVN